MIDELEFIRIVRDELSLPLADPDLDADLDQVVHWESVHVVRLVVALEKETGRRVPVSRMLTERTLRGIYEAVVKA